LEKGSERTESEQKFLDDSILYLKQLRKLNSKNPKTNWFFGCSQ